MDLAMIETRHGFFLLLAASVTLAYCRANERFLRALLLVLLPALPMVSHAEWKRVVNGDRAEFYIDPATVKIKGDQREVWSVISYHNPQQTQTGQIFRSMRALLQLECATQYARGIHGTFYSGDMLRGEKISEMGALPPWEPVKAGTPMKDILDLVCRS